MSQKAPSDLKPRGRGRKLWLEVTDALELDSRDGVQLHEACRIADRLDDLDAHIRRYGSFTPDGRISPAAIEARQQAIALSRVIAALRLPEDLAEAERPQRRVGVRGFYSVKGGRSA
jgi:hypothetical protein